MSRLMEARRVLALKRHLSCHDGLEDAIVTELAALQGQALELNHALGEAKEIDARLRVDLARTRDDLTKLSLAIEQSFSGDLSDEGLHEIWQQVVGERP